MKVKLLSHTPDPERLVATAAKLCYSSSDIESLRDGLTDEKTESFIDMLASIGHESVMEHVSFTFGIEGVSRACTHQLVRHRIASYSQKSQRYVNENGFEFITPPAIEELPEAKSEYDRVIAEITDSYAKIAELLTEKHTKELIAQGLDEKSARSKASKLANEDARFILPNACETKIVVTMNVRSLFNFFRHRCCNRAQWEIRAVANEMLRQCLEVAPHIFSHAGPSCVSSGKCPEGKMTCGKINEVKEYFDTLKKTDIR
ncbi:thymidylate synthase (FAD) [Ruminococcus flavefaciens]|uniref:Flavin-dependent thymidylate synthase n=1 Tax=Ruminococcus flavefaciens TaxID=1265 RepID=A0A1H6HSA1_RUMFL|nr:FAD-dependent thymidylate synthase [Ruminococcus flavefaciens]SEH37058.1 thymidylate synthase (FAD) [Ruminococcus flavefaciens]